MARKDVLIYGAGIAGMVAAFNLADAGHTVTVRDMESGYGGSNVYNPSLHTTPIDLQKTSDYIGMDISSAFVEMSRLDIYIHETAVPAPVAMSYHVERSNRPSSLDAILYKRCVDAGVRFEFDSELRKEDVPALEPGTIIACGLNEGTYDAIGVPSARWSAWMATGEYESEPLSWLWIDECINEYGYISFANGIYYNLLFTYGHEIPESDRDRYIDFMLRVRGFEEKNFKYVHGVTPITTPDNPPKLVRDGLIIAGTMSGMIDPFMGFGISGALISGKIAAIAVDDIRKAEEEFARFNRNYVTCLNFKQGVWKDLRSRPDILEEMVKILGTRRTVALLIEGLKKGRKSSAIPGFSPMSCS